MRKRDSSGPPRGKRSDSNKDSTGKGRSSDKPFRSGKPKFSSSGPKRSGDDSFDGKKKFRKDSTKPSYRKFEKRDDSRSKSGDESKEVKKTSYGKSSFSSRPQGNTESGGERRKKFTKSGQGNFRDKPGREGDDKPKSRGFFSKQAYPKGKPRRYISKKEEAPTIANQTGKIRLNRYIANSGVCSRREADELIKMGLVSVNGKVITEMGFQVSPGDQVRHEDKLLRAEKPVYILMNKPKGYITTTKDPQERNTVMSIIGSDVKERVYPVGRLDRNTTGLLFFTNDGELTDKLSHPSYNVKKIYKVELDRPLDKADFQKILDGVQLEEGRAIVDDLAIASDDGKTIGLEIHIGWNRVVRRIFERLEYQVVRLDRTMYAGLDKKDLPRGHWRFLTKEEIVRLKHYNKPSK